MAGPLSGDEEYSFTVRSWSLPVRKTGDKSWSYKTQVVDMETGTMTVERVEVVWDGSHWVELEPKEKAAPTNEYGPVEL